MPRPRSTLGLCPPSQRSPQAALVMSALGRERETGSEGCFPDAPGLGGRKAWLFVQDQEVFTGLLQPPPPLHPKHPRLLFTLFSFKKKAESTHRAIHLLIRLSPGSMGKNPLFMTILNHRTDPGDMPSSPTSQPSNGSHAWCDPGSSFHPHLSPPYLIQTHHSHLFNHPL